MNIGKRLFPYPVLNNTKLYSQFKEASFTLSYNEETDNEADKIVFSDLIVELNSEYLLKLIEDGYAKVVCVFECANTMYRKPLEIAPNTLNTISISLFDFNGKYQISAFIVATKDFDYVCDDFLEEYEGYTFQVEKNDILAVDDGYVNKVDFNSEEDTKKSSIFLVIKDKSLTDGTSVTEYDQDKITISLPEVQWNRYESTKRQTKFQDMYFSILAVPALAYALTKLRAENDNSDIATLRIESKLFSVFVDAYEKGTKAELDDETFFVQDFNCYKAAQMVLNSPITKAIDVIFDLTVSGGNADED